VLEEKKKVKRKKLQQDNVIALFDFSGKKQEGSGRGRGRGNRDRGDRGDRAERSDRSDRSDRRRFSGDDQEKGFHQRAPREERSGGGFGRGFGAQNTGGFGQQHAPPRKYGVTTDTAAAPQFDDSSFPALQVGPPTTSD